MKNEDNRGNLCQYAIPGREYSKLYQYPYKCAVICVCRFEEPTKEKAQYCPRKYAGDRNGITAESGNRDFVRKKGERG